MVPFRSHRLALLACTCIVLSYSTLAISTNPIWRDEIALWEDAVVKSPGKARPHYNLGCALQVTQHHDSALREFRAVLKIDPQHAKAFNNFGLSYNDLGLYDEAIEAYEQSVALDPNSAKARSNLGAAYTNKGLYGKARQHRQAVRLAPDVAGMAYNLGVALDKKGSAEEAVRWYMRAIELDPHFAAPHLCLGILFLKKEKSREKAIYYFRKSLAIDPGQPQAETIRKQLEALERKGSEARNSL
jgi:tetratricopeptide (TPR) repeat protein